MMPRLAINAVAQARDAATHWPNSFHVFLWQAPACLLGRIAVPRDGDCLFHAIAFQDRRGGKALRFEVAAFMRDEASNQGGFEAAWLHDAQSLLHGAWGGYTAISAYSLMKHVRVEIHMCQPSGKILVVDGSHAQVQGDPNAPLKRLLYDANDHHYEALVELGSGWLLSMGPPPLCTRCFDALGIAGGGGDSSA